VSKFNVSLLALIHLFNPAKTSFMQIWKQSISGCEITILVSSAKSIGLDWELMVGSRSLIRMKKHFSTAAIPTTLEAVVFTQL
jgi:hypothetical protein